jgi:predicted Fe-S protein YdhL (DUF1289 family)
MQSPCCRRRWLDERRVCVGCDRTVDELARWRDMTADEKSTVIARIRRADRVSASQI